MARVRRTFSITMGNELRAALDERVTVRRFRGRSEAIEYYVKWGIDEEEKEKALRERRDKSLSKIRDKDIEKIEYLVEFIAAFERNPELIEKLKEAVEESKGPEP